MKQTSLTHLQLDAKQVAHIIVDVQYDFVHPQGFSAQQGRGMKHILEATANIREFHSKLGELKVLQILTKFVRSERHTPGNFAMHDTLHGKSEVCVEGGVGVELEIVPHADDVVLTKYTYDPFFQTSLLDSLNKQQIQTVLISGFRTDICVDTTARRAFAEGFHVLILEDLVASSDERMDVHATCLQTFEKLCGIK